MTAYIIDEYIDGCFVGRQLFEDKEKAEKHKKDFEKDDTFSGKTAIMSEYDLTGADIWKCSIGS